MCLFNPKEQISKSYNSQSAFTKIKRNVKLKKGSKSVSLQGHCPGTLGSKWKTKGFLFLIIASLLFSFSSSYLIFFVCLSLVSQTSPFWSSLLLSGSYFAPVSCGVTAQICRQHMQTDIICLDRY